jgi:4-carboxymuconolactone decarboxylase
VVEAILHCIPYIGFPRVLNAIFVAKRVFEERGVSPLGDES